MRFAKNILTPKTIMDIEGPLTYNESTQAWGILRFKKELLNEFSQLKDKRSKCSYKMLYPRDTIELDKIVKEIKKGGITPILLFLNKESNNVNNN